jgi:hypothetical protein
MAVAIVTLSILARPEADGRHEDGRTKVGRPIAAAWRQALISWAVANARVELKGSAIIITKQVSGAAKIDPMMAAFNSIALM